MVFWLFVEKCHILKRVAGSSSLESISGIQTTWFKKKESRLDEKIEKKREEKERKEKKKKEEKRK